MSADRNIVFYGTPDFAVPSLKALVEEGFEVVSVVTTPDKPAGRGLKMKSSPVKITAQSYHIPVLQPANLKEPSFLQKLKNLNPALQVVVAFRKLPTEVWSLPEHGTINLHASLLPHYRGAAPIHHAIINGESYTGITTFFINDKIDTGEILFQQKVQIYSEDTAGSLHDRLALEGARLVVSTVKAIFTGKISPIQQKVIPGIKKAPKLTREFCRIVWNQSPEKLYNFIRGLSPYPGAWTLLNNQVFKILKCNFNSVEHKNNPGFVETDFKNQMKIYCPGGYIEPLEVKPENRKLMTIQEFLRGWNRQESIIIQ